VSQYSAGKLGRGVGNTVPPEETIAKLAIERDTWRNKATTLSDHVNRLMRERDDAVRLLTEQRAVAEELRQLLNLSRG
jgi:hypothetical protein